MKSLDQVEPRTPVDSVNTPGNSIYLFVISQPGSYYLTTNIVGVSGKSGIDINTNNVTLNLNGFTVQGVSGTGHGIMSTQPNVVVQNGQITGWGGDGVNDTVSSGASRIFEGLTISGNSSDGISTGSGVIIRNCVIQGNGSFGIYGGGASRVSGCIVNGNSGGGITIEPPGNCVIDNNFAFGNATSGTYGDIYMNSANNHVENNRVIVTSATGYGIYVYGLASNTNNVIIKNDVVGGGARNFSAPGGNDVGPIGTAATSTSPWANISH